MKYALVLEIALLVCLPLRADTVFVSGAATFDLSLPSTFAQESFAVAFELNTSTDFASNIAFSSSGPLGPFTLTPQNGLVINWNDPAGDLFQINPFDFFSDEFYPSPGTYSGVMYLGCVTCQPGSSTASAPEYYGGTVTVVEGSPTIGTPEAGTAGMLLVGLPLLGLARRIGRRSASLKSELQSLGEVF